MKKKLFDRRGAAIELAMLMIVVCFSLSILILSTSMLLHNKRIRAERRMEQSVALEQIGQEFLSAVVAGQVDEDWLPAEDNGLADETIHRHSWQENIIKEATCGAPGEKLLICDGCPKTVTKGIPALEHKNWYLYRTDRVTECDPATPKGVDGADHYICLDCGATKEKILPAHNWDETRDLVTLKPTCIRTGLKHRYCSTCGLDQIETIPPNDVHSWEGGVCTACGLVRPTYSLTVYRTANKAVRYEVTVTELATEISPEEPTNDKVILKITIDEVDGTYLVTEWTKNDRS